MPIGFSYHLSVIKAQSRILAVTSLTFAHYVLISWNHLLDPSCSFINHPMDNALNSSLGGPACHLLLLEGDRSLAKWSRQLKAVTFGGIGARTEPGSNRPLALCSISEFSVCAYRERRGWRQPSPIFRPRWKERCPNWPPQATAAGSPLLGGCFLPSLEKRMRSGM